MISSQLPLSEKILTHKMILKLTHVYYQSSDQEAIMDILCPDLNSDSDSDKDDSLFGTE